MEKPENGVEVAGGGEGETADEEVARGIGTQALPPTFCQFKC